ncbi:MAG: hypothetical protein ACXWTL_08115 [Methylobacter sp.]
MSGFVKPHQVRAALVPYFLRIMRINGDDQTRDAMVQQIVLLNGMNCSPT